MFSIKAIYAANKLHIQKASNTCGPTTLINVLELRGLPTKSEAYLKKLCGLRPGEGTRNTALATAVTELGLEVVEVRDKGKIGDIERHLDSGSYVILNYSTPFSQSGHYAIAVEYDRQAVYLFDSWLGLIRLVKKDLRKNWHNSAKTIHGWFLAVR